MKADKPSSGHVVRLVTVVLLIAALVLAGCGSSTKTVSSTGANGQVTTQTVPSIHFANTKFVFHAGLAFAAFHRYIYKPLRAGALRSGAPGRIRVLLKGAAAAVFIVHELKIAHADALASNQLRPLANKLDNLGAKISGLASSLKHGSFHPADILGASGTVNTLGAASSGLGARIKELPTTIGG